MAYSENYYDVVNVVRNNYANTSHLDENCYDFPLSEPICPVNPINNYEISGVYETVSNSVSCNEHQENLKQEITYDSLDPSKLTSSNKSQNKNRQPTPSNYHNISEQQAYSNQECDYDTIELSQPKVNQIKTSDVEDTYDILHVSTVSSNEVNDDKCDGEQKCKGKSVVPWLVKGLVFILFIAVIGMGYLLHQLQQDLTNNKQLTKTVMEKSNLGFESVNKTFIKWSQKEVAYNRKEQDDLVKGIERVKQNMSNDIQTALTFDLIKMVAAKGTTIRFLNGNVGIENKGHFVFGRVEILHNKIWGSICGDSAFDNNDANAICRTGGYTKGEYSRVEKNTITRSWLHNLKCAGTEETIDECPKIWNSWKYSRTNCRFSDAVIKCYINI